MGKGMQPKKGYNQKKYDANYGSINWGKRPALKPEAKKKAKYD